MATSNKSPTFLISLGVIAVVFVLSLLGAVFQVAEPERTVVLTNGEVSSVAGPGIHYKWPIFQSTVDIRVAETRLLWNDFSVDSYDQQPVDMAVSVTFSVPVDKVADVYRRYGNVDGLVSAVLTPNVYSVSKTVIGQYTAAKSVQNQGKMRKDFEDELIKAVSGTPLFINSVQIQKSKFKDSYYKAIEATMDEQVKVEREKATRDRAKIQAETAVATATGKADSAIQDARGRSESVRLMGEAEALAIASKGEALKKFPEVLDLTKIQQWKGDVPGTIMGMSNGVVPMFNMK